MGKPKDVIWNVYDVDDDKTTVKYKECQSDISNRVLRLKCHRKKCPVLRNILKKRTFDCTENDETSHDLNESTSYKLHVHSMPAIIHSIFSRRLCFQCNYE